MKKKGLKRNKGLCIFLMIVIMVVTFLFGGMWKLNSKYNAITSYFGLISNDQFYERAREYNGILESFPANVICLIMPVKGEIPIPFEKQ